MERISEKKSDAAGLCTSNVIGLVLLTWINRMVRIIKWGGSDRFGCFHPGYPFHRCTLHLVNIFSSCGVSRHDDKPSDEFKVGIGDGGIFSCRRIRVGA